MVQEIFLHFETGRGYGFHSFLNATVEAAGPVGNSGSPFLPAGACLFQGTALGLPVEVVPRSSVHQDEEMQNILKTDAAYRS